jgi:transposase
MSFPTPTAAGLPTVAAGHLPDDPVTLQRMVLELVASLHEAQRDNEALRHRLDLLLRRLYGPRGERFDPNQPLLFAEPAAGQEPAAAPAEVEGPPRPKRRCRPHGRRRLPEDLPRQQRHHELAEAQRLCPDCGEVRLDIGTDRSEQLEYRPASLFVIEHFVHKYACPCCTRARQQALPQAPQAVPVPQAPEAVLPQAVPDEGPQPMTAPAEAPSPGQSSAEPATQTADTRAIVPEPPAVVIAASKPAMPIAKGLPGPGLLAHLIVSKYTDHLPLHRLQHIYERQGVFLHRSTLCDWLGCCADVLPPLYDLMVRVVLQSRALHTDDTTVKLQDPKTHLLSTARLWGYLGDAAHPFNVFDFTVNRKRDGPVQFLANYQGYLHADAFSGYDCLYLPDPLTSQARIVEVACNAHARRKFYEARNSDALRSHQALAYYRQLYELERAAKDFSDTQRLQMRQDLSLVILGQFHKWLEVQRPQVLPKSPIAEALGYALNNWTALTRYTEAGYLAIDNNVAEREMKRIAIGRKNWLSVGSPRGGQTAAVLMSFTSTCQRLGVEPWAYLQDVLTHLPSLSSQPLTEWLPDRWEAARRARLSSPTVATPSNTPAPAESTS